MIDHLVKIQYCQINVYLQKRRKNQTIILKKRKTERTPLQFERYFGIKPNLFEQCKNYRVSKSIVWGRV